MSGRYAFNLALALDQLGNVLAGGEPDETISSAVGRKALQGRWLFRLAELLIDLPFWFLGQSRHCVQSIEWDELSEEAVRRTLAPLGLTLADPVAS